MSIIRSLTSEHVPGESYHCRWVLVDGETNVMVLTEDVSTQQVTLTAEGSLRSDTVRFIKDELIALATVDANVILDLSGVSYISNSCIRAFVEVQVVMDRICRGNLTLVRIPQLIMQEFKQLGLDKSLIIE